MSNSRSHFFFTVDVEEWFTSSKVVKADEDLYKQNSDLPETMNWLITLLSQLEIRGTFFFIYDIAVRFPDLVHRLLKDGHEIGLHGQTHADLQTLSVHEFEASLIAMKTFFSDRFSVSLKGYRAPYFSLHTQGLALLKKTGFVYDSSVVPCIPIPGWYGQWRAPLLPYFIGQHLDEQDENGGSFMEFPLSVFPLLRLPGLGGLYFRNLGSFYSRMLLRQCLKKLSYAVFYLHPWELSNKIPSLTNMPFYLNRHAGNWTRNALRRFLQDVKSLQPSNLTLIEYYDRQKNSLNF